MNRLFVVTALMLTLSTASIAIPTADALIFASGDRCETETHPDGGPGHPHPVKHTHCKPGINAY